MNMSKKERNSIERALGIILGVASTMDGDPGASALHAAVAMIEIATGSECKPCTKDTE